MVTVALLFKPLDHAASLQIGKGSDRMKQHEASKLLRGFKQAFSEQTITAIGRSTDFFKRERKMTPMKMMMSLLLCFAGGQSTTLADVQRSYNALSPTSMAYKPFHNQLSKAAFARFMQELASHVLFTLQTVPAVAAVDDNSSLAKAAGFSLHAGVASEAHEREKLERLCRTITRPAVSTERLLLTAQGNIRYRLKTPYRMARRTWCLSRWTKSPGAILNSRRLARRAQGRMPGVLYGPPGRTEADAARQPHALPRRLCAESSTT